MQKLIIRLFFILASAAFANVYGQNITFNHLTTDDGLSQFSVNSLYVDENGILWIGTREGLNRYNGDDIQTYKLQKNNPNSLFCNTVSRITGNHNGKIYLLCTEGVAEFNLATQKFTTLIQGNINSIYYNDGLFIGKKNEIYRYNEETGNFDLYYQLPDRNLEIVCIHINKDVLWLGTTTNGVYCLNIDKKELTHPIQKGNITSFYQDSESELWIGSWEEGLFRVKADGTIENFKYNAKDPHSLSSNFVRACCEDNLGNIWIGTFNGLNRYNKITGLFQNHTANDTQADGLTHSSIWCIVKDNQGTLWLGTYFGGVNYFNPEYEIYTRYSYSSNEKKGLSNPVVGRTIEDKDGNLWIGTDQGPFYITPHILDDTQSTLTQVKVPRNDGTNYADYLLGGVDITCMAVDQANRKWFGTSNNGIYLISADNMEQIHHFTATNSKLLSNNIESLAINDATGEVFIGTNKGLCSYMSDATATNEEMTQDNVWVYPNPVKPDYTGLITITGLSLDADVKIISTSGTLVNQGRSNGGTYTWNGCDLKGRRVASGIYMVETATSNGEKGTVCKIAIIR